MAPSAAPPPPQSRLKIGIIGFGRFGKFLANTMIKQGHDLSATSLSDESQVCAKMGVKFFKDLDGLISANNQVILICASIPSLDRVVQSIPMKRLRKHTLFVDVLSVKEYPKETFLRELPEDVDILCTHPMFGPDSGKDQWEGLPFMYERVRITDQALCYSYLSIFQLQGCKMVEMSCEEHDRMAAQSQFITHTVGRMVAELGNNSTPIDTKSFKTLLQLSENTVKDSDDLYIGLFKYNRFAKTELEKLELAFYAVKEKLLQTN